MTNEVRAVKRDFTRGNLPLELLKYALPFMATNALQVAYSVVDMTVVGRFVGTSALTAVATASQVVTLITMLGLGFSTGGQVAVASAVGSNADEKKLNATIGTLFTFVLIASALSSVVGTVFSKDILLLLRTPEESMEDARKYLVIMSSCIVFPFGYNAVSAVLRGLGNSVLPLVYVFISSAVNVGLNLLLVKVCALGVVGSAWATVAGQGVSLAISVVYVVVKRKEVGFDFKLKSFVPGKEEAKNLLKLGVPFAMRSAAVNASMTALTAIVNADGVTAGALFGVGVKTDDLCRKITIGINYSVTTFVAQNRSANKHDRVRRSVFFGMLFCAVVYLVFGIVYLVDAEGVFGLFTTDKEVLDGAKIFTKAILWAFPAMIVMRATNGYVQGSGKSVLSFILALVDGVVLRIGLCYLLGVTAGMGEYGLFLGYGLASYGSAIPGTVYFVVRERRKRKACKRA